MRLSSPLALFVSAFLFACDGGAPADSPAEGTPPGEVTETPAETPTETPDQPAASDPTDPAPVEPSDPSDPSNPNGPSVAYPEGPYGTNYLDTVADLGFFDPWTGATPHLSDYFNDPNIKVLLISSGAGWCTACMYESWDLVDVYDKYKDRGLEILYTLYEDRNGDSIFQEGDSDDEITADLEWFQSWKENLGKGVGLPARKANYPVLVDPDFVLEPYYNMGATPLTLIVRTSDMRILYREVGYVSGTVEQMVRGHLN